MMLRTSSPGLELNPQSDVKLQGLVVGEVREITSDGRQAEVHLALSPDHIDLIPADVDARIIPKTLFGEKYVDLLVPDGASDRPIADGDVITQSTTSVEIGDIYSKLVPLLRTVDPAQLSTTLNSLADALDGRGRRLGETISLVNEFLGRAQPRARHPAARRRPVRAHSGHLRRRRAGLPADPRGLLGDQP